MRDSCGLVLGLFDAEERFTGQLSCGWSAHLLVDVWLVSIEKLGAKTSQWKG